MGPFPGARFGRYEIVRKLGEGGMGEVYLARDRDLGRDVAVKFLPERFASDPGRLGRFAREARAASAFNHPSIISIYEIGHAEGLHYIAMELVEGETLRAMLDGLRGRPLPVRRILDIMVPGAEGLAKAHAGGIVHRDLEPENLMLSTDGFVKILDFGVAKLRAESEAAEPTGAGDDGTQTDTPAPLTSAGAVMGTAAYMSPEQARGSPVDFRSDQFAFGSILYEMASGRRPFKRETMPQTLAAVIESEPEPLARLNPELPAPLCWIVERCLAKDPADRSVSTQDLARELRTVREHLSEAGGTGAKPVITRDTRAAKRYRLAAALAAVVILAGASFLFAVIRRPWAPRTERGAGKTGRPGITERDTIVLADIENRTGDAAFDDALKQALMLDLGQSPFLDILSERKVRATLRLMGRPPEQPLTGEVAREVCQRAGSRAMIAGSISALGGEYVIGLHAADCASGDALVSEQARASGRGDVLKALDSSASAMRTSLGESLASVEKDSVPIEEATTSSLEALKAYGLGRRVSYEKGEAASVPYLLRAIELDPNFALAYASVSIAYSNLGQAGRAVEAAGKAYDLRDRVSEREKYRLMAYYFLNTGDLFKAIQACEFWKQNYPRDNVPAINLGAGYMWVGQWERAVGVTELAIRLDPNTASASSNLATIQLALNRYQDARATLEQAFTRKLDPYFIHLVAYEEAFLRGDAQAMQRHASAVAGHPGEEDWLIGAQSDTEAYFGRARQARELSRRAAESARLADAVETAALWHAEAALRDAELGRSAAARAEAAEALDLMSGRDVRSVAALALARAGDAARARKLADRLDKEFPQHTQVQQYWLPSIRAAIAIDAKDAARAVEVLEPAETIELAQTAPFEFGMIYPAYLRGQAYLLARRGNEAAAESRSSSTVRAS